MVSEEKKEVLLEEGGEMRPWPVKVVVMNECRARAAREETTNVVVVLDVVVLLLVKEGGGV